MNATPAEARPVVRLERSLACPTEMAWRALTQPAHLARWYPCPMELDLRVGGRVRALFAAAEGGPLDGVVTELVPPRVFAFREVDDLIHFELRPAGAGCRLVFTHTFDDPARTATYTRGWNRCLDALEALVGGLGYN